MHSDHEVLTTLREHYSESELAQVLGRLLRVPEAWRALRDPDFLDQVVASDPPTHLTPSHLAALALGGEIGTRIHLDLARPHATRAEQLWQQAMAGANHGRDLFETALVGLQLAANAAQDRSLTSRAAAAPPAWRSPLCVAWPALRDPESVLADLLDGGAHRLAIQVVLSNLPVEEAVSYLTRNANGSTLAMLLEIWRADEAGLVNSMAIREGAGAVLPDTLAPLLLRAVGSHSRGEPETAREVLARAWETAARATAHVADFTAHLASAAGDAVTELEANQRALDTDPSASRKARTARTLARLDRTGDAMALLSAPELSVEEQIVLGTLQFEQQQTEQAVSTLSTAASRVLTSQPELEHEWYLQLAGSLQRCSELESAIQVGQALLEASPASASAHRTLAELLAEAGDWESCAAEADLALAIDPYSEPARELLAQAFERIGDFGAALQQRRELMEPDPKALANTAIEAGELDLAGSVVEQMLTDNPSSVTAHIALGRILAAKGERASANGAYQEAVQLGPRRVDAHLALANLQRSSGDIEAAGQTLMQAAQLDPNSASVQSALATWMDSTGRGSEATEAAAKAVEIAPDNVDYRLQHARLLSRLGHLDQALSELSSAAQVAPRNWKIRIAIAEIYEKQGRPGQAAGQLPQLPESASAGDWLTAGRIGVRAGVDLSGGMEALAAAESRGNDDPELHYWFARSLEQLEQFKAAAERYAKVLDRVDTAAGELREQSTLGLARCELHRGRISGALEVLDEARQAFGDGSRILALTAKVYLSAKLVDKAVELAQDAVEADRNDPNGWEALSEALASSGDFDGAFSAAEQHATLNPGSIDPWLQISRLASDSDEQPMARQALARAIWYGRGQANKLARVANYLAKQGLAGSAIRTMRVAVGKRPEDSELLREMAELLESCGELEQAQETWIRAAQLAPGDEQPLRMAARCAERLGRAFDSIELLERAQSVNPHSPGLRRQLASAYVVNGDVTRGMQAYSSALRENPNDVSLAMEAAEAALRVGAAREALGFVGRAQQLAADEGRVQAALGEGYLLLSEPEKAEAALDKAVELGESSPRVVAMLSLIRPDSAGARQALTQSKAQSVHDAIWLARAHTQLLEFDRAMEVLSGWNGEPAAGIELARVALRQRDAEWLLQYADLGDSSAAQSLERTIDRTLTRLRDGQLDGATLAPLLAWQSTEQSPESLLEHVAADATGQLGEATIIAQLKRETLDDAVEAVELTKDAAPDAVWLKVLEGICHERSGRPEQARAAFRKAADGGPLAPVAQYLIGRSYAAAGSLDRAVSHMGKAATRWIHQPQWQYKLGQLYLELNDADSALGHFQSAVGADPEKFEYQLALAKTYLACGHVRQAESAFGVAIGDENASGESFRLAGEVALQIGRPDEAAARFARACSLAPQDPLTHVGAANAAAALGEKQQAEQHLRAAIQLAPDQPEVLLGQGQVLMQTGKSAAAMQAFDRALETGADPAQVHRSISKLLMQQGHSDAALRSLRQAVEADPQDDGTWHDLALALEAHSDLAAADEAVGKALRIAPRNPEYQLTLARISRRSGNLDRAIEELRKARKAVPDDPRLAIETGLAHEDRREYSRALDAYREAIEIDATCLEAYYRAGLLLRTLKAYRRAGEMLKHAADLAPINKEVLHQLAAVRALELVHG